MVFRKMFGFEAQKFHLHMDRRKLLKDDNMKSLSSSF